VARDFFCRSQPGSTSPSGTVIADIQAALNAIGSVSIPVDGLFGRQTEDALSALQTRQGFPNTGTVADTTWTFLMRSPSPSIFERSLQVTASFEGTGFSQVVGNFDGAGLTWGIVGFTLVNGEMGAVLAAINQRYPDLIAKAFGHDAETVVTITGTKKTKAEKIAWADSISRGQTKYSVAEPWRTYFSDLGSYREVKKIQVDRARNVYWGIAVHDVNALGLGEELDYSLLFDVAVQNGGMRSKNRLANALAAFQTQRPRSVKQKRSIIAQVVADTIRSTYKQDVLSRKMTIATGTGVVHHSAKYKLSDWGLLDGQVPPAGV
jgi:peptidoglycan hydrolase-like protein with peptidoglycan-binding domain